MIISRLNTPRFVYSPPLSQTQDLPWIFAYDTLNYESVLIKRSSKNSPKEIELWKLLNSNSGHPNLPIPIEKTIQNETDLFIFKDQGNMTLENFILSFRPIDERTKGNIFVKIVKALHDLQEKNNLFCVPKSLSTSKVLLTHEMKVKLLADFVIPKEDSLKYSENENVNSVSPFKKNYISKELKERLGEIHLQLSNPYPWWTNEPWSGMERLKTLKQFEIPNKETNDECIFWERIRN